MCANACECVWESILICWYGGERVCICLLFLLESFWFSLDLIQITWLYVLCKCLLLTFKVYQIKNLWCVLITSTILTGLKYPLVSLFQLHHLALAFDEGMELINTMISHKADHQVKSLIYLRTLYGMVVNLSHKSWSILGGTIALSTTVLFVSGHSIKR